MMGMSAPLLKKSLDRSADGPLTVTLGVPFAAADVAVIHCLYFVSYNIEDPSVSVEVKLPFTFSFKTSSSTLLTDVDSRLG